MNTTTLNKLLPPEALSEVIDFINTCGLDKYSPDFIKQLKVILKKYNQGLMMQRVDSDYLAYAILNSLK